MIKFLYGFTAFLCAYFVLYVTGNYYLEELPYIAYVFPLLKELSWFIFVGYCAWIGRTHLGSFISSTKGEILLLCGIAGWGIIATVVMHGTHSSTLINIIIGLKYGLYSSIIFYTAARVGYGSPLTQSDIINYITWLCRIIVGSLIVGLIRQGLKRILPDGFYQVLGYGPVGDYVVGQPHPIYYRTGPGGRPRFSGLMSGPNNLGYLLVAYTSLIPLYIKSWGGRLIYCATIIMTLSRAALLGSGAQGLMVLLYRYGNRYRKWIVILGIIIVVGIGYLSFIKGSSSIEHLSRTWGALTQVIQHPRGIGLGSSGPGVHWNGSVLPENFYLQLLLDYGTIPFIGRCIYWIMIIRRARTVVNQQGPTSAHMRGYVSGLMGLLIVGLFLHVFEDSVVNYLFFIPFGLLWGHSIAEFAKSDQMEYTSA